MEDKAAAGTDREAWERARDHAWRYFEVHAAQRMTMVNYYIVLSALSLTGIAGTLQAPLGFASIGVALGMLLVLLSFVFWKIDRRSAFLVKHAEAVQKLVEAALLPEQARLFTIEPEAHKDASRSSPPHNQPWTIGTSLRVAFAVMAFAGFGASVLCASRAVGYLDWDRRPASSGQKVTGKSAAR